MLPPDDEIIRDIRMGAKHRFALLVDRYKDRGLGLAIRMLKDRLIAEEALQDAFVRAYNGLNGFQGSAKFGTWFYRILYNVCLTKLGERQGRYQTFDYEDGQDYSTNEMVGDPSIEQEIERKEMVTLLKATIDEMPVKYSTVLSLFYFQELSHREICEVTRLSPGTVKIRLFRARAMLLRKLSVELQKEFVSIT